MRFAAGAVLLLTLIVAAACKVERLPPVDLAIADAAHAAPTYGVELDGERRFLAPAHTRKEFLERRVRLGTALPVLTSPERARVLPRMDILALVSVCEGTFDGIATHAGDPMASLGIFQWAGERAQPITEGSSLQRFLAQLQARAGCDDHCTARDAWRALASTGLSLRGGTTLLHGKPATGAMLEQALHGAFASPTVQAYQLLAAVDWIEHIAGLAITVPNQPPTTLRPLLHSDHALATAVLLGVNRPAWVAPALTQAVAEVGATDEDQLVDAFRKAALERYTAREREARAMRLVTSEVLREP